MALVVRENAEPFTEYPATSAPALAESDAFRRLRHEIRRYAQQESNGRSFLVSGHRGAGKTTMVLQAVWEVMQEATVQVPLLIRLQGPDLLPDVDLLEPAHATREAGGNNGRAADDGAPAAQAPPTAEEDADTQGEQRARKPSAGGSQALAERALRQITQAIYRSLSETIAEAFARAVTEPPHLPRPPSERLLRDRAELAARFRLMLDEAPSPAELRELYRLGGVLDAGVLEQRRPAHDQGMRELTALSSAAAAFRVVAGTVASHRKLTQHDERTASRSIAVDPSTKDLVGQVVALVLGGAAGAGTLAGGEGGAAAAAVGVAAALGATLVVKVSSSRTRRRTAAEDYTFLRDHSPSTLERELPVLIDRIRAAGLAPVFVVDELDKVDGLREQMNTVVGHLKQFVSERAFFCFLTDRDYFEHLRDVSLRQPYPHEHTFFHRRIFVLFRPADLHGYLERVLDVEGTDADDEIHKELLAFQLRHRSKMHAVDLRRELVRISDEEGYVLPLTRAGAAAPSPGSPAVGYDLGLRLTVMVQLAVELLLDRDPLRGRLDQDPHFAQPAYDALYYLSRVWEQGGEGDPTGGGTLDLSATAFHRYLAERMNPNPPRSPHASTPAGNGLDADGEGRQGGQDGMRLPLSSRDEELLRQQAIELARLVADPERLAGKLDAPSSVGLSYTAASRARDAIPRDAHLLRDLGGDRYAFCFDPFGRELDAAAPAPREGDAAQPDGDETSEPRGERRRARETVPHERSALAKTVDEVRTLDRFVYDTIGMSLATLAQLNVLSAVPTWSQVESAIKGLEAYVNGQEATADTPSQAAALDDYVRGLSERTWILASTIRYGSALGAVHPAEAALERRTRGVTVLATSLAFERYRTPESLEQELRRYIATTELPDVSLADLPESPLDPAWQAEVADMKSPEADRDADELLAYAQTKAWDLWRERLERRLIGGSTEIPLTEADLLCVVAEARPATVFPADLDEMTLAEWGEVLSDSLVDRRPWLTIVALVELGVGHLTVAESGTAGYDEEAASWVRRLRDVRSRVLQRRPWAMLLDGGATPAPDPGKTPTFLTWQPSHRYGAVPFVEGATSLSAANAFLVSFATPTGELPPEVRPSCLFVDRFLDNSLLTSLPELKELWEALLGERRVFVVQHPTAGAAGKTLVPVLPADSLDRAMEQALKLIDTPS